MEVFFVERLVLMIFQEKVGLLNVFLSMTYRASRISICWKAKYRNDCDRCILCVYKYIYIYTVKNHVIYPNIRVL